MTLSSARATYGLNAQATPISPNSVGTLQIGANNSSTSFSDADVAYSLRAILVGSGDVLALDLLNNDITGSTSFVQGAAQVETATVVAGSGATSSGNLVLTVTAAGMTGSPKAINVPLVTGTHTTATLIAAAAAVALNADTDYAALFTATSSSATIITTRKPTSSHTVPGGTLNLYAANDATLNVAIGAGLGVTAAATSADTTAGVVSDGAKIYGAGEDFEGEAMTPIVTLYSVFYNTTSGTGVIAGDVDDVLPYSAGLVAPLSNANGLTIETDITATAATVSDITITVVGKSS